MGGPTRRYDFSRRRSCAGRRRTGRRRHRLLSERSAAPLQWRRCRHPSWCRPKHEHELLYEVFWVSQYRSQAWAIASVVSGTDELPQTQPADPVCRTTSPNYAFGRIIGSHWVASRRDAARVVRRPFGAGHVGSSPVVHAPTEATPKQLYRGRKAEIGQRMQGRGNVAGTIKLRFLGRLRKHARYMRGRRRGRVGAIGDCRGWLRSIVDQGGTFIVQGRRCALSLPNRRRPEASANAVGATKGLVNSAGVQLWPITRSRRLYGEPST